MKWILIILLSVFALFGICDKCMSERKETEKHLLPVHFTRMHKLHHEKGLFCKICHEKEKKYPEYAFSVPQYSSSESPGPGYVDKSICLTCHRKDGDGLSENVSSFYGVEE